jgi:hypothetical protein
LYWAVYADETPVGFVMIADDVEGPDYVLHYLWKLLIDERHQRHGFTTSAGQGPGSPIAFYERYGFERTGDVSDDEAVLQLKLREFRGRPIEPLP